MSYGKVRNIFIFFIENWANNLKFQSGREEKSHTKSETNDAICIQHNTHSSTRHHRMYYSTPIYLFNCVIVWSRDKQRDQANTGIFWYGVVNTYWCLLFSVSHNTLNISHTHTTCLPYTCPQYSHKQQQWARWLATRDSQSSEVRCGVWCAVQTTNKWYIWPCY